MFVCIASPESAEPDTLVVMRDFADRDALTEEYDRSSIPTMEIAQSIRPCPIIAA